MDGIQKLGYEFLRVVLLIVLKIAHMFCYVVFESFGIQPRFAVFKIVVDKRLKSQCNNSFGSKRVVLIDKRLKIFPSENPSQNPQPHQTLKGAVHIASIAYVQHSLFPAFKNLDYFVRSFLYLSQRAFSTNHSILLIEEVIRQKMGLQSVITKITKSLNLFWMDSSLFKTKSIAVELATNALEIVFFDNFLANIAKYLRFLFLLKTQNLLAQNINENKVKILYIRNLLIFLIRE